MTEVEAWLDEEEQAYSAAYIAWEANRYEGDAPERGFRCNWASTKKAWREGNAKVDLLIVDDQVVGFLAGTGILEIRPGFRKNGYGRVLAEFMIKSAYDEGRSLIEIRIAPFTAESFWKRMGFTSLSKRKSFSGGIYAFKILPRVFRLTEGERVPFSVEFYSEDERYKTDPQPFSRFSGLGERLSDGSIQLPERAYCFQQTEIQRGDDFVKIDIDADNLHFFDKAERRESRIYGVEQDKGYNYYLDRIYPLSRTR